MRRRHRKTRWRRRGLWGLLALLVVLAVVAAPTLVDEGREWRAQRRIAAFEPAIQRHAVANALPVDLVRAVIRAESSGDPDAVSRRDARGLMQITPIAHEEVRQRFGLPDGDLHDPDYNILVGTTYLRYLLDRFEGDVRLALAGYHMGPTRVATVLRENPGVTGEAVVEHHSNPTTRAYVRRIMARLER